MIEIKNLSHSLSGKSVLKEISLTVKDGTILGIVGINGAGKSTFLRLLCGVYKRDCGSILIDGIDPESPLARQDLFFLPDDPYYTSLSTPKTLFNFYKNLHPDIDTPMFFSLISEYGIDENGLIRNFSKGMRRQVFIAIALAIRPKYLLLDEAFDGLDPLSRKIFKNAIISLVEENGATVLISSHSLRELEDFCDSFILLDNNRIKSGGSISEHVSRLCKFELAFKEARTEGDFAHLPMVSLSLRGRFATVVLNGESEDMRRRLEELSPLIMDELPIDFEEAFIYDVQSEI